MVIDKDISKSINILTLFIKSPHSTGSVRHPKNAHSDSLNQDLSPNMEKKTSSDTVATQDPDLARVEGLHPREGITRHSALPVGHEVHNVQASSNNPIAAGQVITSYHLM